MTVMILWIHRAVYSFRMKPGDRVRVKSGPRHGWSGNLREIVETPDRDKTQLAFVDWDGRAGAVDDVLLAALEPEVWLRLTCCPVGATLKVCWLYPNRDWKEEVFGFFPKGAKDITPWSPDEDELKTGKADWALVKPRSVLGGSEQLAVRVRFCPGCGTKTPKLRKKAGSTSFHRVEADFGGTCKTCNVRYCGGEDPSLVFEIDPT